MIALALLIYINWGKFVCKTCYYKIKLTWTARHPWGVHKNTASEPVHKASRAEHLGSHIREDTQPLVWIRRLNRLRRRSIDQIQITPGQLSFRVAKNRPSVENSVKPIPTYKCFRIFCMHQRYNLKKGKFWK